jgi:ATP-dependent DNA helicase RecQ
MQTKESILKQYFGYDEFRPLQAEIIDTVLAGQDALVLMPTGGGKSVCYQVPAMLLDGLCVVISPLIALMKDQVQALRANGIPAAYLNSSLGAAEQSQIEADCLSGRLKLLYISPEKLFSGTFMYFVRRLHLSFFAVDESHCVSFWGHDFRPEYAQLKILKQEFPQLPVLALTATADKVTRRDILTQLAIPAARVFIASFDRPNLSLTVLPGRDRIRVIADFISRHPGQSGIVYCLSRKSTEDVATKLRKAGYRAEHYHAGMDIEYRSRTQDAFIRDDVQIIVATVAFGMGIDKSNIRWVIHYNLPKNVESFYQEIGRAGRDGMPSKTLLFYSYADYAAQMDMNADQTEERRELLNAKLGRMKQYAEAEICRRRILLSYFNEVAEKDCGNCDVCQNPRSKFDATVLAQKALSAVARTGEQIAMGMLTDILRGSHNRAVTEKGYDQIKTFGAGRELRNDEWNDYLLQMLNSGVVDIAYDEGHSLKLNPRSWEVLKGEKPVMLVKYLPYHERKGPEVSDLPVKTQKELLREELFERLRLLRRQLADQQGVPAYVVFTDATLNEMTEHRPVAKTELLGIAGVSREKFNLYGEAFIGAIGHFMSEKGISISRKPQTQAGLGASATYLLSLEMYEQGLTIEEIAQRRNLNPVTIVSHLVKFYEEGRDIDLWKFVNLAEVKEVVKAAQALGLTRGSALKPLFEALDGRYQYYQLRMALAIWEREGAEVEG